MSGWTKIFAIAFAACLAAFCMGCSSSSSDSEEASATGDTEATMEAEADSAEAEPGSLADGAYDIVVETDSSMFHVEACTLNVEGGQMTATITLPGEGFSRLYYGTVEEAETADDADIYEYVLDDAGKYTFTLPVAALDEERSIAAWGQRRDRWYDHTIMFCSPGSEEAADAEESDEGEPVDAGNLSEGEYTIEVTMDGGTGKASIASPAKISVAEDGSMTATLVWSSSNYDQMVVDGVQYLPITIDGGSTFEIPVAALDEDLPVQAETTAMSEPHMIDYTLHFDSGSMRQ